MSHDRFHKNLEAKRPVYGRSSNAGFWPKKIKSALSFNALSRAAYLFAPQAVGLPRTPPWKGAPWPRQTHHLKVWQALYNRQQRAVPHLGLPTCRLTDLRLTASLFDIRIALQFCVSWNKPIFSSSFHPMASINTTAIMDPSAAWPNSTNAFRISAAVALFNCVTLKSSRSNTRAICAWARRAWVDDACKKPSVGLEPCTSIFNRRQLKKSGAAFRRRRCSRLFKYSPGFAVPLCRFH
jgi:hypothetical protein